MPTTYAPGIRPTRHVCEERPTCSNYKFQCAWDYVHVPYGQNNWGYFQLKFINLACPEHKRVPHTAIQEVIHYGPRFTPKASRNRGRY